MSSLNITCSIKRHVKRIMLVTTIYCKAMICSMKSIDRFNSFKSNRKLQMMCKLGNPHSKLSNYLVYWTTRGISRRKSKQGLHLRKLYSASRSTIHNLRKSWHSAHQIKAWENQYFIRVTQWFKIQTMARRRACWTRSSSFKSNWTMLTYLASAFS